MSRFFKEVSFEIPKSPIDPIKPKTVVRFNDEKLAAVIKEIRQEFEKIKHGKSDLTHYSIDIKNFGSPVRNGLAALEIDKTVDSMKGFIELAKQEVNAKAATAFMAMLKTAIEEVPNE